MKSREEILQAALDMRRIADAAAGRGILDQCATALAISSALMWCVGEPDDAFGLMLKTERERFRRAEQAFKN